MESIEQTFNGSPGSGKRVTCQISRNGDLIHKVYLQVDVPANTSGEYVKWLGLRMLKNVEIEIGGQRIDKHYADWMYIWNDLSLPTGKSAGYQKMVGADLGSNNSATTLYVPLEFWFCRNVGLALPLIALQYHEVKINIEFESLANLKKSGTVADIDNASLWVDYIFLDTDERRRFAQLSHEYLIEQLQFTGEEAVSQGNNRVKLNFNHPCKELVWVIQADGMAGASNWFNYTLVDEDPTDDSAKNNTKEAKLQLNGHDRFAPRAGDYFNLVQPFQHHENVPSNRGISVYSFALKPEEHQPSGTLNMSRIDTAVLSVTSEAAGKIKVFATNYNVLRIMSGMGGLAYSN
jgi:hypothetical protein